MLINHGMVSVMRLYQDLLCRTEKLEQQAVDDYNRIEKLEERVDEYKSDVLFMEKILNQGLDIGKRLSTRVNTMEGRVKKLETMT